MHRVDTEQTGVIPRPPPQETKFPPIRRVPPEILSLFFTFTKPSDLADCIPSLNHPPLTLLQVCSSWKSIALATPDLWTALCISMKFSKLLLDLATVRQYEEMTIQWFSRAGPHLGLSLQFGDSIYICNPDFSNLILSHPERFRELSINLLEPDSLATFAHGHGNASAFSQLEDLTIECHNLALDVTFAAAGRLRRMKIQIPFLSWEKRKNFAPWKQLTCLYIGSMETSVWVPLVAHCINLENGTFGIASTVGTPVPTVNVMMAHLTSFDLTFTTGPLFIQLFEGFRFPALMSLRLMLARNCHFSWTHPEHFYRQLILLRIFRFIGNSEDLVNLLRHTPSLVSLHATTYGELNTFLVRLTVMNESDPLIPGLNRLTIRPKKWTFLSSSVGLLLKMVTSRTLHTSACPLEYLSIIHPNVESRRSEDLDLEQQLRALPCQVIKCSPLRRYEGLFHFVPRA